MSSAIAASNLSKRYGEIEAVRGIDVTIASGETVALLGPNGAGKSTTIDMISASPSPTAAPSRCSAAIPRTRSTPGPSARCCRPAP